MDLDNELEMLEESGQTEAEQIDEESEIQDVCDDVDEELSEFGEPLEGDLEHAYSSFITNNEADYNGYDPTEVDEAEDDVQASDILHSEGYHIEGEKELVEEAIEMEIEEGDIYAYIFDEEDNEIGFVLIDEDGNEQEYYYVNMDEYEIVEEGQAQDETKVIRAEDGEEFDLGLTREEISETTASLNAIYKDGAEVAAELKETLSDISDGLSFLKKR